MKTEIKGSSLIVTKEQTDKKIYSESAFYHALKVHLQKQGYDIIKKLMSKDGHMVDDHQYYLRSRLKSEKRYYSLYDGAYAIRQIQTDYNEGSTELIIQEPDNFKPTLPTKE